MNATPDLELVGVSKRFGDHLAVAEVSFAVAPGEFFSILGRSEEHTSELQSQSNLVCRLLLEKKKPSHFRPGASVRECIQFILGKNEDIRVSAQLVTDMLHVARNISRVGRRGSRGDLYRSSTW